MRRSLIGFRVIGVVLLLGLAGCGGDPKTDPSPAPSTPVTSPASTTPSPPAMPDAARANTRAGAIAFVRHYIDVFNHAQLTGSTDELSALSSPRCQDCQAAIQGLDQVYGAGGHIEGGALLAGPTSVEHNALEHFWLVLIRVDSGPQSVTSAGGAAPTNLPGGRRSMKFSLARTGESWKVTSWSRT
jgi:Family of unknown function (DUF6318)